MERKELLSAIAYLEEYIEAMQKSEGIAQLTIEQRQCELQELYMDLEQCIC